MRLCIPTMNERGLDAPLSAHFGSAPYYTVVETDTGKVEVAANARAQHEHGHCEPVAGIAGLTPGAVVCMGLGRRALDRLQAAGIQVFMAPATQVSEALSQFQSGALAPFSDEALCGGHSDGNGHGVHEGPRHKHGSGAGHRHGREDHDRVRPGSVAPPGEQRQHHAETRRAQRQHHAETRRAQFC